MKRTTAYLALGIACSMLLGGCSVKGKEQSVEVLQTIDTESTLKKSEETEIEASTQRSTEGTEIEAGTTGDTEGTEIEASTQEEIKEPLIQKICVTATGDCTLGKMQDHGYEGSFCWYYDQKGPDYFFEDVKSVFEKDDFTIVNLECVLSESTDRVEKTFNLKGEPGYTAIMTGSSVEACSLGNNHSMDYGYQSLVDTQNALDEAGIVYGYNQHIGTYTTKDGLKIGVVSASLLSQSVEVETYLKDGIAQLKAQDVDLVIACCHWGIEKQYYPIDYQKRIGHELIDCGADLVVGSHPHVLQGIELYNNKVICYSLGNFCFGGNRNPSDKNTMMYQQTFTYVDGELQDSVEAQIIPCTLSSTSAYNDFRPTIVSGDKKQSIIDDVNTYSAPYSNIKFDSNGKMTVLE